MYMYACIILTYDGWIKQVAEEYILYDIICINLEHSKQYHMWFKGTYMIKWWRCMIMVYSSNLGESCDLGGFTGVHLCGKRVIY